jgi:L-iditol 2-dehydrogenase
MSFQEGALLEPLSVVLSGLRVAELTLGRGAVICGAGPIGLTALLAARASGAHPLVVTDIEPGRLAFARELVPSCLTYQVDPSLDARGNARGIRGLFGARGGEGEGEVGDEYFAPPCVIECTGVESSVCTAAFTVRRGGRIVVVGVGKDIMNNLPFMHLSLAEVCFHLYFVILFGEPWESSPCRMVWLDTDWVCDLTADRSEIYQQVHGHVASGNLMHERWDY